MKKNNLAKVTKDKTYLGKSFNLQLIDSDSLEKHKTPHIRDHFCIILIEKGILSLFIDGQKHALKQSIVSFLYPHQIVLINQTSDDLEGKILLFDELSFCSDTLKNRLKSFNVDAPYTLNSISQTDEEFANSKQIFTSIENLSVAPSREKNEQAHFYIKILLLSLLEQTKSLPFVKIKLSSDMHLYSRFLQLLEENYLTERKVTFYANALSMSTKKLNFLIKQYTGNTALYVIHLRIIREIQTLLFASVHSHKEISFHLGFSSPSALTKFVKAKLEKTPSNLQKHLHLIYDR